MESKHRFIYDGALISGLMMACNPALGLMGMALQPITIGLASGISLVGGYLLDRLFKESEYEKLFRLCGIENKAGQIPVVIKEETNDNKKTLIIHMPEGISLKHFEKKQEELEQHLNSKIELGFNKNLVMKLINMNLSTRYSYVFESQKKSLEVYCGETHSGKFILDIEKCPHILLAGETDSGKSSLLDNITLSLILNTHNIELNLIDFQAVTLGKFENCKKVKSYGETPADFDRLMDAMEQENERRIKLFRSVKNKVHIDKLSKWNELYPEQSMPYIINIIDEFSRLSDEEYKPMMDKFRNRVSMDRKTGIHYITSMQRPDVKCISGSIKANMPTRIAFKCVTDTDSEVILDVKGAEKLKNQGRFLIKYCGELTEVQGLYIEPEKIRKIIKEYGKFKSAADITAERKEQMKTLRGKCINPYLKG